MTELGSVTEAMDALNLPDAAAVWDAVASGQLVGKRDGDSGRWTIYIND